MIGKPISGRNRETPVKDKISRERSTDRRSQANNFGDGRHFKWTDAPIGQIWAVSEVFVPGNGHTPPEERSGGGYQLSRLGSNPGGGRPILIRKDAVRRIQ